MNKAMLICIIPIVFLLSACSDPVADDLVTYMNEDHEQFKQEMLQTDELITAAFETENEEELHQSIQNEVLPKVEEVYNMVMNVELQTEPVQELHNIVIQQVELYSEAITIEANVVEQIVNGEIEDDSEAEASFAESGQLFEEAVGLRTEFEQELDRLMDEHNVQWEEE